MYRFEKINDLKQNIAALSLLTYCFVYPNEPDRFTEKIAFIAANKCYQSFQLLTTKNKTIGIIIIEEKEKENLVIQGIVSHPNFQRTGIASKMIQQIINIYQPKAIFAETDDDSVGFYQKNGFITKRFKKKQIKNNRYFCKLTIKNKPLRK